MPNNARRTRTADCTLSRQKRLVINALKGHPELMVTPADLKKWTGVVELDFTALVREQVLVPAGAYYKLAPDALVS